MHERMAVTSLERTLFDQAATAEYHDLANQFDVAVERQLYDHRAMEALIERHPGVPGAPCSGRSSGAGNRLRSPARAVRRSSGG